MDGVIIDIVKFVAIGIVAWAAGRFSVKTKTQVKVEDVCADVAELKQEVGSDIAELKRGMQIVLQCQLASMVALKRGEVNGECDKALKALNKYLIEK